MTTNILGKVVRLAFPKRDSDFLDKVKDNLKPGDRVLVIISSADLNNIDIGIMHAGLTPTDQIALLEVAKLDIYTKLMAVKKE